MFSIVIGRLRGCNFIFFFSYNFSRGRNMWDKDSEGRFGYGLGLNLDGRVVLRRCIVFLGFRFIFSKRDRLFVWSGC